MANEQSSRRHHEADYTEEFRDLVTYFLRVYITQ